MRAILRSSAAAAPAEAASAAAKANILRRKLMGAPLEPFVGSLRRPSLAASRGPNPAAPEASTLAFERANGQAAGPLSPQPRSAARSNACAAPAAPL